MISNRIIEYLQSNGIPFQRRPHQRAISASELAQSLHVTGYRVAKSVVVEADGRRYIVVLPAPELVNVSQLSELLGAPARLLDEREFAPLFPDCEVGAEPPFGKLYGLPVIMDRSLETAPRLLFRAGSHTESLEMAYEDFVALEKPWITTFAIAPEWIAAERAREARV